MARTHIFLGIDLGGTQVKGAAFDGDGRLLAEETRATGDCGDGVWREQVGAVVRALRTRFPTAGMAGLCAPGLAAVDERTIVHMPGRLAGLEGFCWEEFLGLPTVVINDAHAALLGEVWQGAARGATNAVMLTLGTGVGGAIWAEGKLLRGHLGRAGHLGHISLNPLGRPDIVNTPGSLEDAAGDCTVSERSGGRFASTRDLVEAHLSGDAVATVVWMDSVRGLAVGLTGLINVLDPEVIVLGGGIARAGAPLFAPLENFMDAFEWRPAGRRVRLVPAALGVNAGACGAAFHACRRFPHL